MKNWPIWQWVLAYYHLLVLALIPLFYVVTLAQGLVLGDPSEFTFVANILGIAHPPGYAFITVVGKLFQTLNPFGAPPWRMHLLSAAAATLASFLVYGTIRQLGQVLRLPYAREAGLFAALSVATAANFWQHAIHTNPHIITATFLSLNIYLLVRWWSSPLQTQGQGSEAPDHDGGQENDRWLYAFSLSAGLGVTHHPLTVFAFPAYLLFILWVRPSIWKQWRSIGLMLAFAAFGLGVWLYFPIRSSMQPDFGPHDMNTLDGFLDHILARGLADSLPFFGLEDQPDRAVVFWTLSRLQYPLPTIFLAVAGLVWLAMKAWGRRRAIPSKSSNLSYAPSPRPLFFLIAVALFTTTAFVIGLRQQDIMAYLLGTFLLLGLLAGAGLLAVLGLFDRRLALEKWKLALPLVALTLLGPVLQIARNAPRISLRSNSQGDDYVAAVFETFGGTGAGAVLLNDWEHMTPLWYKQFVEQRRPDPADVRPHLVAAGKTWLENVFDFLPGGPVYLSGYRADIVEAGFRLRPQGPFYEVVEPGDTSLPAGLTPLEPVAASAVQPLAFTLPARNVTAGDFVAFTLALRSETGTEEYYTPVLEVGDLQLEFTTDSHLVTPLWQPGEVIVERFDFALPRTMATGIYPLELHMRNLSTGQDVPATYDLDQLTVSALDESRGQGRWLANFRQRVALVSASARKGLAQRRSAPWEEPIRAAPGDTVHLTLQWQSLAPAEESYTVFVHLIDLANRPLLALDYTPLGGSSPTHLWIPKWLPGQRLLDPYRLEIPPDIAPGTYLIEAGLYEMTSRRRLHISDVEGNLAGDRMILGSVEVQ